MIVRGPDQPGQQVKDRCNRCTPAAQQLCLVRFANEAVVSRGLATLDPPAGGGEQDHPGLRPAPDAPRLGVGVISGQGMGGKCMHQVRFLGLEDRTFAHRRGFDLHEFGKACTVVAQMPTIALDPTMIRTFAPGSIDVEMMQPGRDTARLAV